MRPSDWYHLSGLLVLGSIVAAPAAEPGGLSHRPLREAPPPSKRPMGSGPAYFVDARRGDDKSAGTRELPWRTIGHALTQLRAGDTLCLRGGVYYERLYIALSGGD